MQPLPFALTEDGAQQTTEQLEVLHKLHHFIAERRLLGRGRRCGGREGERGQDGRYIPNAQTTASLDPGIAKGKTIASRLIVFQMLIDPTNARTLTYYADQIGVDKAQLSRIGAEFSASLGMSASWQRLATRSSGGRRKVAEKQTA